MINRLSIPTVVNIPQRIETLLLYQYCIADII